MLLVDIGNTAVKWGLIGAENVWSIERVVHREHPLGPRLDQSWGGLPQPQRVVVASVAGEAVDAELAGWVQRRWSLVPEFMTTGAEAAGVRNAYEHPGQLGVDRWSALVGAHHHIEGAVCIVDCGTAVTVDWLAAEGDHLGGLILPGIGMLCTILDRDTAAVLTASKRRVRAVAAQTTADGVRGGAVFMVAATIDRLVEAQAMQHEAAFTLVLCGGDAREILPLLARPAVHEPELVLKGLAILAGEP